MMQNQTKTITIKMNMAKIFKKIYKRCYQWLYICRKNIINFKIMYAI